VANATAIERDGENAVGLTGTPSVDLELDTDIHDAEDLVCLEDTDGNVAWAAVVTDNADGTYVLDFEPQVDGSAITPTHTRPTRQWNDDDGDDNSSTFAGMYLMAGGDFEREIPGLRISSLSIEFQPAQFAFMSFQAQGDDFRIPDTSPSFSNAVNGDPASIDSAARITGCVYIDGEQYASATATVDFGIEVSERPSTCRPGGRVNRLQMTVTPTITVVTPFSDDWTTLDRDKGVRDLKVVSGLSGPSVCFWAPAVQLSENPNATDTNGILDQSLSFMTITQGSALRWALARS